MTESARPQRQLLFDLGVLGGLLCALLTVFVADVVLRASQRAVLDIVFILDEGTEMGASADGVTRSWVSIAESFAAARADCRWAVIPCPPDSTRIPRIAFTADLDEFKRRLAEVGKEGGLSDPWRPTDCLEALEDAARLEFREAATRYVFLTTNTLLDDHERVARIARTYEDAKLKPIVQAHPADQGFYRPLYRLGGQFLTLSGENRTEPPDPSAEREKHAADVAVSTLLSHAPPRKPGLAEQTTLAGVQVRGNLALICDISGSMGGDFPPLVRELREKFPPDTPLILIEGCVFPPPMSFVPRPERLGPRSVFGVDFTEDDHVYRAFSTTDAILMAAKVFRRETVMFNNDLQDGGTAAAIRGFDEAWQRSRFTLSGRSLNCDAPRVLKDFIARSGGEFKVDPISRSAAPALDWAP